MSGASPGGADPYAPPRTEPQALDPEGPLDPEAERERQLRRATKVLYWGFVLLVIATLALDQLGWI